VLVRVIDDRLGRWVGGTVVIRACQLAVFARKYSEPTACVHAVLAHLSLGTYHGVRGRGWLLRRTLMGWKNSALRKISVCVSSGGEEGRSKVNYRCLKCWVFDTSSLSRISREVTQHVVTACKMRILVSCGLR
jgi:hypothetical protein